MTVLYFAYTARIAPDRMAQVAPSAVFSFIAHLPEWGLSFPIAGNGWNGALPSATPSPGSTVWGAVYQVPHEEMSLIHSIESSEGREPSDLEAIDRSGRRFTVKTHLAAFQAEDEVEPSPDYLAIMLHGSRHWGLPAGWVIGLEDHLGSGQDNHVA